MTKEELQEIQTIFKDDYVTINPTLSYDVLAKHTYPLAYTVDRSSMAAVVKVQKGNIRLKVRTINLNPERVESHRQIRALCVLEDRRLADQIGFYDLWFAADDLIRWYKHGKT